MTVPEYSIDINIKRGLGSENSRTWLKNTVKAVLISEKIKEPVALDLLITDDRQIHRINKKYRGIDSPTDVLSFALNEKNSEGLDIEFPPEQDGIRNIGEIIISFPRVCEQADEHGVSVDEELTLMITHGVLHLLGYDHIDDSDAKKMSQREKSITAKIKNSRERK